MCFKKIWNWILNQGTPPPQPPPPIPGEKRRIAILAAINNYPGSANDLNGCLNDIDDVELKLKNEFPAFMIKKMKDSQVTVEGMYNQIKDVLVTLTAGDVLYWHYSGHGTQIPSNSEPNGYHEALYLYNGPFLDDQVQELQALTPEGVHVIAKFDSCFSGDMLRNSKKTQNRFYPMPGLRVRHKVIRRFGKRASLKGWVVFSGCGENQTSADAYINGRFNGAFTYYDNKSFSVDSTNDDEITKLHTFLPKGSYDQNPTIDGDSSLFTEKVFT
jgi:hypothetical protein